MKVAVSSDNKDDVHYFRDILFREFAVIESNETEKGGLLTGVYTITRKDEGLKIQAIFEAVELVTGVDPKQLTLKKRYTVRARKAVCYLLHERLGCTHEKIAHLLGYGSHASSLLIYRELKGVGIKGKGVSLEVAVRRVLVALDGN